jgi:hypothetical protein
MGYHAGELVLDNLGNLGAKKEEMSITDFPQTALPFYSEKIEQFQRGLKYRGYDPGTIDGKWGPKTLKAFNDFIMSGRKWEDLLVPFSYKEFKDHISTLEKQMIIAPPKPKPKIELPLVPSTETKLVETRQWFQKPLTWVFIGGAALIGGVILWMTLKKRKSMEI